MQTGNMLADRNRLKILGLSKFYKDFDNLENQYLNLIFDPMFNHVVERWVYDKTIGFMDWKCAICNKDILINKNQLDPENFVCDKCKVHYNNKSPLVDRRIFDSRNTLFKYIEDKLYEELEDNLQRGKR